MDDFHCSLFILPEKLQYDIKSVAKQSVLWWSALLSFILKARLHKIDPTYLLTGEKNHTFDVEMFLANCSREERDKFLDRMLIYMRKLMISPQ